VGKGELFAILSALTWAFGVILYKRLGERLPPLALNLRKNLLVLAMLLPLLALWHGFTLPDIPPMDIAISLASGLLGIAVADTMYFRALNRVGAGRMGIVGNFLSPFVLVLAYLFLDERLVGLQIAGFALVSLGVLIVSGPHGAGSSGSAEVRRAIGLGVLSILLMAAAIVLVKRVLERHDLLWISAIRMLGAVAGMLAIGWLWRDRNAAAPAMAARDWAQLAFAAFVGQLLSMLLWLAGYKYTSASVAAILNETASIFIVLLAWLMLREPLGRRRLVGIAFTLAGVVCMLRPTG
jgi:drug/metabolite transporter (DMT)-like permease